MSVVVKEVKTKSQRKLFITFPDILFKNCKNYLPQLHRDEYNILFTAVFNVIFFSFKFHIS